MAKPVDWNSVSVLTPGMKNLGNQFNVRWPNRDGASDGALGDTAHQAETSDHNRDDTPGSKPGWDGDSDSKPEVRAIDVDNNLNDSTCNFQDVIDHLRTLPNLGKVIRYMIYNRKMYHVNNGFVPTAYTGASAHTEHGHFSGAWTDAADANTTFDFQFEKVGQPTMLPINNGASGQDVAYVQYLLTELGYSVGTVDGNYGSATQTAVNAHRSAHGQGPSNAITAWHYFQLHRDLAIKHAGKPGTPGVAGKDGAPGKDGKDATLTGTLTVTGGQLIVEAQND